MTLVFDREGWSPKFFREAHLQGFDILTYRKGRYAPWPVEAVQTVTGEVDGREVTYAVAEQRVEALKGFSMREIRRLCANGHQSAIVTTRWDLAIEVAAYRMFERWTQENFFRYMRQHFSLDALVTYATHGRAAHATPPAVRRREAGRPVARDRMAYGHVAGGHPRADALAVRLAARAPGASRPKPRDAPGHRVAADGMAPGEPAPTHYWLSTLPETTAPRALVRLAQLRWRVERDYQELKDELGLDHFEGRGWRGFHHHGSLCIAAYAFLAAERARYSPLTPRALVQAPRVPTHFRPRGAPGAS